jgi:glycosyltransferase involved in cell wall biosynthesis
MKEAIFIFSYNREEMLKKVVESVKDYNYFIIDDGSDFALPTNRFYRFTHQGKETWWKLWNTVFQFVSYKDDDLIIFTPDDFLDLNIAKIFELHEKYKDKPYVYNIVRDHRDYCWNHNPVIDIDSQTQQIGFVDCGFFCNREVLKMLEFKINPIDPKRFRNKSISSGVGEQLTARINKLGIPIYRPVKSLATHGNHPSVMHPKLRELNKIISKH